MPRAMGKSSTQSIAPKKSMATSQEVADEKYLCYGCGKKQKRSEFYSSTDPFNTVGIIPYCKDCLEKIARNYNPRYKEFGDVTKTSLMAACERADVPYIETLWESSCNEVNDPSLKKPKTNVWAAYIKNVKLRNYNGMRWRDGDLFKEGGINMGADTEDKIASTMTPEVLDEYKTNKRDLIRLIGYDPFANYPVEQDLPVLYAQIISFIDEETKNDGMKMNAVIQIVQAFNQIQKLNDAINELLADTKKLNSNNGTIKQHSDTISKLLSGANALAKDNGISVNFNNSKSKGQNTLTGKMKELDLIGFRDAKINMYDIDYCQGMRQVAEISAKAQIDQIGFDENVMMEISNIRRELVDDLQKQRDKAVERARLLLVENKDLKEFLKDKGLIDEFGKVIDNE
jgi:regulator of replication initiation timing